MEQNNQIVIYQTPDGQTQIDFRMENDTVWLSTSQMSILFDREESNIRRHVINVFNDGELERENNVQNLHVNGVKKPVPFYNLDVIISVGYRVKSQRGVQFRQWANKILKEYLVKGYAINNRIAAQKYEELSQLVHLLGRTINNEPELITGDDSRELVNVVTDYTYALDTLDRYDYQQLTIEHTTIEESFRATYDSAMETIETLKEKFGGSTLFGKEKDGSFRSSIGQIYQTFDGDELYPSVEEKAAMLLYLVVKNHSFVDGNKRIAATLFLWFMQNNGILYNPDGTKRISDGTLVALTLMIAESRADEKDMILKVIVNLINKSN